MPNRISKRDLLAQTIDVTGCGRLLRAVSAWQGVLILNYHRVGNRFASQLDRNLWSATTEDFEAQMKTISRHCQVIGMNDLESALQCRRGRQVMITFDDGYRDNYTNAFPILKACGVPATFFITTGFVDSPKVPWWDEIAWMARTSLCEEIAANPWTTTPVVFDSPDRERVISRLLSAYKVLPGEHAEGFMNFLADAMGTGRCPVQIAEKLWMTWDMIREMKQQGMTFGGHTVTHPVLANISHARQDEEIATCRRRLIEELGVSIDAFSYPVGGPQSFSAYTREAVIRQGFKWAFTFIRGYCRRGDEDRLTLPRTAIETDVDLAHFRAITTLPQVFA